LPIQEERRWSRRQRRGHFSFSHVKACLNLLLRRIKKRQSDHANGIGFGRQISWNFDVTVL
jgi:hypothetical protein